MRSSFAFAGARRLALTTAMAALLTIPALTTPAMAAPMSCGASGPSRLTVVGQGQSRVAPDMATVQLGVTTQADSASDAMAGNNERQRAVIEALTAAGIAEDDIQTSGLNLNPLMQYGENQAPTVTGYQAVNTVSVRVMDLDSLGAVLDAIVGAGANEINGITFAREDGADALDQAQADAVTDARRKAQMLADAAGVDLGPVLTLREIATGGGGPLPMLRMQAAMADSAPVQPGQVDILAQVEIDYALTGDVACAPMHGPRHGGRVYPPMHGDGAPAPDEPTVPGIVEPLPDAPAN